MISWKKRLIGLGDCALSRSFTFLRFCATLGYIYVGWVLLVCCALDILRWIDVLP